MLAVLGPSVEQMHQILESSNLVMWKDMVLVLLQASAPTVELWVH